MFAAGVTRNQAWAAAAMWLASSVLTLQVTTQTLDREPDRDMTIAVTTVSTILGPMTGAIARHGESSCLAFSLSLLPVCLGALLFAILVQLFVAPEKLLRLSLRWSSWCIGLAVWFGGGVLSLGQALS